MCIRVEFYSGYVLYICVYMYVYIYRYIDIFCRALEGAQVGVC